MATQGPKFPTAATNTSTGSETAEVWVNPTNVFSDNATEAAITAATYDSPDISQQLVTSGYGFTIPAGSTIDGITVEIDRRSIIASSGKDFRVQLRDASGTLVGTNKAVPATIWPTTSAVATYGGAADTWTASPTATMVNDANFGVVVSCQANIANADVGVDFIRITITYTVVGPGGTRFYFLAANTSEVVRGTNTAKLDGTTSGWGTRGLGTSRGSGVIAMSSSTVAGPTSGIESVVSGFPQEFISPPVDADVTISGTIMANIWGSESSLSANAAINVQILKMASDLTLTEIVRSTSATELPLTTGAAQTFTTGMTSGGYSGVTVNKGERIVARIFGDDAGTMATGFTFAASVAGTTVDVDGDSWIEFTEAFGLLTADPTGSTLYLTDTASDVATADVDREAWTSRGGSVLSDVTNTTAGWTTPIQVTDTAGGTSVSWYTKQLQAFTLTGKAKANIRALESAGTAEANIGVEIARVDSDGTNPTIWAYANAGPTDELALAEGARLVYPSDDDLAFTDGQRIRIRLFVDDSGDTAMGSGQTVTTFYNGPSAAASGDTYVILPQTVTEYAPSGDEDVTPTTVAGTTAVPALTAAADGNLTTVEVAGITTVHGATVSLAVDADVTPTTVAGLAAVPALSITADANLTTSVVATETVIDTPSVDTGAVARLPELVMAAHRAP